MMTEELKKKRGRPPKPKSPEEAGIADLQAGLSVAEVAEKHGVSYGTALWWNKKQAAPSGAVQRPEHERVAPLVREAGRY